MTFQSPTAASPSLQENFTLPFAKHLPSEEMTHAELAKIQSSVQRRE
jgi:hypothetical protein